MSDPFEAAKAELEASDKRLAQAEAALQHAKLDRDEAAGDQRCALQEMLKVALDGCPEVVVTGRDWVAKADHVVGTAQVVRITPTTVVTTMVAFGTADEESVWVRRHKYGGEVGLAKRRSWDSELSARQRIDIASLPDWLAALDRWEAPHWRRFKALVTARRESA